MGLERGPLSLKSTTEELLERKSSGSSLEIREYDRRDPSCRSRGTLYPQKLVLTSPTSAGRSIGIVRSRTQATEFSFSIPSAPASLGSLFIRLYSPFCWALAYLLSRVTPIKSAICSRDIRQCEQTRISRKQFQGTSERSSQRLPPSHCKMWALRNLRSYM
jgi:hypothetical protein